MFQRHGVEDANYHSGWLAKFKYNLLFALIKCLKFRTLTYKMAYYFSISAHSK